MNVAIVEDNTSSAKNLQSHLARFEKETGIDIRSSVYKDGIDFIANYASQWDLVLMDIEMPVLDGMRTAKKLRELDKDVLLIFVTQLAQYAISAFEVDAMDYMLKPVNYYAFYLKMQRVVHKLKSKSREFITIKNKSSVKKIAIDDIRYIDIYGHTLYYHTAEGTFPSTGSKTLKELSEDMKKYGFQRCSQSYLVNLKYVKSFDKETVTIYNEGPLPVSRQMRKEFMQALMETSEG